MSKKITIPRGTADILPGEVVRWQAIEKKSRDILALYGYREIRTPIFEETELFARSMGQTSDVVQKQMLSVIGSNNFPLDEDGAEKHFLSPRKIDMRGLYALRPEGTASIVRSYIENSLDKSEQLSKLYYIGPMFRGERPQKGRLRQFHQIGVEAIGPDSGSPYLDAEVISLSVRLLNQLGLRNFQLKINTLGTPADKENFAKFLRKQLTDKISKLCPDCQQRLERNVFRILDCKNKDCKAIVDALDVGHSHLSVESQQYYTSVKETLVGMGIQFVESAKLVRGLDYYTHTVFEISSSDLGSQDALGAGGRYNNLVAELGGPQVDAIGFALGIERILLALPQESATNENPLGCYVIALDQKSLERAINLVDGMRQKGLSVDMSYRISSMKSQMRMANKVGAQRVLILGEEELRNNSITVKNMSSGEQKTLPLGDVSSLVEQLGKV